MIIAITGTPGVGKSRLSKVLSKNLGFNVLHLNREIKRHRLYSGYDKKRKTYIADMKKVDKFVKNLTSKGDWIIDSHLSHLLPTKLVDKVIVLRCDIKELERRLKKKRWNKAKIQENIEAEMVDVISYESKKHKKVLEITYKGPKSLHRIIRFIRLM